jgi:hypothetical protein
VLDGFQLTARTSRYSLNSPSVLWSHRLLYRFQPNPVRFLARIRCRRIFFSTHSLM